MSPWRRWPDPTRLIGLCDAWAMVAGSGLPLATVRVGGLDWMAWATIPEFNQPAGPRLAGMSNHDAGGESEWIEIVNEEEQARLNHGMMVSNVVGADYRVGGVSEWDRSSGIPCT